MKSNTIIDGGRLCPNHHTLLDIGGIYIADDLRVHDHTGAVLGPLSNSSEHPIGLQYFKYHRELWGH